MGHGDRHTFSVSDVSSPVSISPPSSTHRKTRKLLILASGLGRGGGTERNVAQICRHIDQSRYEVHVWTLVAGGEYEQPIRQTGIDVRCLGRGWAYSPLFALRAARQIANGQFDLVHCFHPATLFYGALAKAIWRIRAPLIFSSATSILPRGRHWLLQRWSLARCNRFAANSPASRDLLAQLGVSPDRVTVIPNGHRGTDYVGFTGQAEVRQSFGVGPEDSLAIFVGRFIASKRVCDLIDALASLPAREYRLRTILVGTGPQQDSLVQQISARGLRDWVQFTGLRQDVPQLLQSADLFLFPSEVEGLPNAVIEAALAGLPVVACDIPGARDILQHHPQPVLPAIRSPQAIAQAIRTVLDDLTLAREQASVLQLAAQKKYSMEASMHKLYELYEQASTDEPGCTGAKPKRI